MNVALVGVTGYSGMVLYQLLQQHPEVATVRLFGHPDSQPQPLMEAVPNFVADQTLIEPLDTATVMASCDVIFFATSAGVTTELAGPFIEADFPVIDLSGDYRLQDPQTFTKWYHKPAPATAALQNSHYGLVEFANAAGHNYIANPGCYATATLLGLAPLVQQQLIDPASIIVDAKSGTSGAGKKLAASTHFSQTDENLQLYKVNQHQHIPEIMQQLKIWNANVPAIQFTTTLLPIVRGIMDTIYAKSEATAEQLQAAFTATYADSPFVRVLPAGQLPTLKEVVGTNYCDLGISYNPVTHTVLVISVIDNLVKGAAGQAVQNFNQHFGFDATAGLQLATVLP
ncbi:MAG: N-acetyl-gamma-glutamyl-phosphate reductase [Loigolactobacillus coryniformis]|uniref:N-acetyl-gamma-glutamyl-phosphate reductase n=1 Tax=Loigolactobacillus coryniformis subsp. coryniformis KCTC 3167 = DSM 20001 TaxID=913848 RepID=A0A0R1FDB7_9LACO|nr:N-acetyl-gamma-glutamyl-phosphate reductase [Loigolactobacillus coryniformis]ATO54531.1 N-acetyl-gamma-glutamyl-phosphate reductase [Loigolactobacillus coryniformis subsp. coryniformis KCTC 3167 = DSM 20001]KRK17348.1 N-acetyl-gamma-glutamyl-phosphate reductase [Loigolactobacillus coryniformis subsp. coryniformis KCTC 3167 = DSM 20001]MDN5953551.1 N-acetyl-gamma-glutamyl-phosphate reductase [Loigolactobacillus coryniformis]OEH89999.1 N-acetyl-gamma-glutamyl-phosphate reductase [Loigolactobac